MSQTLTGEDRLVYDHLRAEMEISSHGSLFQTRDSSMDPLGLLSLENAYFPPHQFDLERFLWLRDNVVTQFIITPDTYGAYVESLDEAFMQDEVVEHILQRNGSTAVLGDHKSYADIPIGMTAFAEIAHIRKREPVRALQSVALASRQISMFQLDLLREDGEPGFIVEDGLLCLGGYLQSIPASASGYRARKTVERDLNGPVRTAFAQLLNQRSNVFEAPSGTQEKPSADGKVLVMDTVSPGTVKLLTEPNQVEGAERLLAIPTALDCDPFADGSFTGEPVEATHQILTPRFLRTVKDVTRMMNEIAHAATVSKSPGRLPSVYKEPNPMSKKFGPKAIYKD
jgi:hypothetical protein